MKYPCAAVFFDLDGTLIDSLEDIADAANAGLRAFGLSEHPLPSYTYFVGDGFENMIRQATPPDIDEQSYRGIIEHARETYRRNWARKTLPYPGIVEMLEELERRKIALAVLTNKPHEYTPATVRHFFPRTPFTHVLGSPPGGKAKPDPAMALGIARDLGIDPCSVMFMGDTRTDMDTAANAGMISLGVTWGFRPESELLEHGARILIRRPDEIFSYLQAVA